MEIGRSVAIQAEQSVRCTTITVSIKLIKLGQVRVVRDYLTLVIVVT